MKAIYTAVMSRLKSEVEELKWIDLDEGQLDRGGDRPSVAFPCALISVDLPQCVDLTTSGVQQCTALVTVRIIQNPLSRTNASAPAEVRETSLQRLDLIEKVSKILHTFKSDGFSSFSRTRQSKEARADLLAYRIEFQTTFLDSNNN
jgi:hypothetical protein